MQCVVNQEVKEKDKKKKKAREARKLQLYIKMNRNNITLTCIFEFRLYKKLEGLVRDMFWHVLFLFY